MPRVIGIVPDIWSLFIDLLMHQDWLNIVNDWILQDKSLTRQPLLPEVCRLAGCYQRTYNRSKALELGSGMIRTLPVRTQSEGLRGAVDDAFQLKQTMHQELWQAFQGRTYRARQRIVTNENMLICGGRSCSGRIVERRQNAGQEILFRCEYGECPHIRGDGTRQSIVAADTADNQANPQFITQP